ncbi:alpha/beta fold hydrolase [Kitasatospora viridis]|uniref:Pimeloyl-ACP methyl ester carboxylesterase n=1 Tax=Kitasatospora viridis TaxID=281105 RepID=A0A561UBL7_9ACTN|nr:alpha/beta hydrolase [Kitasatospora viridis]TWF96761.1 pimeloyl-ACP methyl ester carboxylesterase [Kitasatospora viridis]
MPHFASYDDTGLWYERLGTGAPLVVLPGGPGTDLRYLAGLGGLDRHRELIPLDGRASGRSEVPHDRATVAFTAQARDVEALREHLGLERLDLLAHSAGCLTAQEYAAAHPGRVRRAVLVTPVGRAGREPDPAELADLHAARAAEPWYPAAAAAQRLLTAGDLTFLQQGMLQVRTLPFAWHEWNQRHKAEHVPGHATRLPWLRAAFYADAATPDTLADRLARLAGPRVPYLVIAGASDGMIGTAPARAVAELHPDARLEVLARSGHRPWVEQPAEFVQLVTEFLNTP